MDARPHAVVNHRFEKRQSAHDQPGWRGACGGERRVLRLPRDSRGSARERAIASPPKATAKSRCISTGARHAGRDAPPRVSLRWSLPTNASEQHDRHPRPLRGQAALLRSGERRRVLRVRDQSALLALGVPAAWDLEGATGGMGRSHEKTEFAGISTVPPGCYVIARARRRSHLPLIGIGRSRLPSRCGRDTRSDAEIVEEFREALRRRRAAATGRRCRGRVVLEWWHRLVRRPRASAAGDGPTDPRVYAHVRESAL